MGSSRCDIVLYMGLRKSTKNQIAAFMLEVFKISFAGLVVGGLFKKADPKIIVVGTLLAVLSFIIGIFIKED